jgi:serine/threonine protein kinase
MWGTKEYFAPEVYEKAYGPQVDVWALGCVLYELLVGETPFPVREKPATAVERILFNNGHHFKRSFEMRPGWQALSAEARDLISRMLKVNPRRRLSVAECLAHPWITGESIPESAGSSPSRASVSRASFALASTVQAPVSDMTEVVDKAAEKRKVLTAARETAQKMVNQRGRKLQMLAEQLGKERA